MEKREPSYTVDGNIGATTIKTVQTYLKKRK